MPSPSKVSSLPVEVRDWLDKALVEGNFSDYDSLSDALHEKGFDISRSSVGRYGKDFKDRLETLREATHFAREIVKSCPDDENALGDATMRLVQEHAFKLLIELKNEKDSAKKVTLIGKMVSQINKTAISQKKWAAEARAKIDEKLEKIEAENNTGKRKLDPETLRQVREEIYGVL